MAEGGEGRLVSVPIGGPAEYGGACQSAKRNMRGRGRERGAYRHTRNTWEQRRVPARQPSCDSCVTSAAYCPTLLIVVQGETVLDPDLGGPCLSPMLASLHNTSAAAAAGSQLVARRGVACRASRNLRTSATRQERTCDVVDATCPAVAWRDHRGDYRGLRERHLPLASSWVVSAVHGERGGGCDQRRSAAVQSHSSGRELRPERR